MIKSKTKSTLATTASLLALAVCAQAADAPQGSTPATTTSGMPDSKAPPANAGVVNDALRKESSAFDPWDFGGQVRVRWEDKKYYATPGMPGVVDFKDKGGNSDNNFLLLREKIHLGYSPSPWLTLFGEARDSSSHGDERNPNPEADTFDLHQGYLRVGDPKAFPLTAKVGRQEMVYGDERLIGVSDWTNNERVFDAAKVRYENDIGWVDAFASRLVIPRDNHFNESNDYEHFFGVYGSTKTLIPKQESQLYFLSRNVGAQSPFAIAAGLPPNLTGSTPRDIYTIGVRFKSLPGEYGAWDYDAEVAGQFGKYNYFGVNQDQEALAGHIAGGYTFKDVWAAPRVGLEYNYASGDDNPADGKHRTFDNLYPTNHKFYGIMDFVSWQNIHDARLNVSLKPATKLALSADYHAFWLEDKNDFFYAVNGAPRTTGGYGINPGAGSYVGSEVDLVATYSLCKCATVQGGYGHFFVGDYVKNSLAASGSKDADFIYMQFTLNF